MTNKDKYILQIKDLKTSFFTNDGEVKAVNEVNLNIKKNTTLGLVGESGSGKSITALSILNLIQSPGKIIGGKIEFQNEDLLKKTTKEIQSIRGNKIAMIFQEPMTSLNPSFTVGFQIAEAYQIHHKSKKKDSWKQAVKMLEVVGMPSPEKRAKQYPHELSGGMQQRVMIGLGLSCTPDLLIADEPTTALDVTVQAQILKLMKELQNEIGMSILLITHDLGVVAEACDEVAVMYAGKVLERATVNTLFKNPKHPYTVGLLNSLPRHDIEHKKKLDVIPGTVPSPEEMPTGCPFSPRCAFAREICIKEMPELKKPERIDENHKGEVRCWIYSEKWDGDQEVRVYNG